MRCHACGIGDTGCGGIVTNASGVFKGDVAYIRRVDGWHELWSRPLDGDVSVMPIRFCPWCGRKLFETRMEMAR